jgi:hypothetical protein
MSFVFSKTYLISSLISSRLVLSKTRKLDEGTQSEVGLDDPDLYFDKAGVDVVRYILYDGQRALYSSE